MSPGWRALEWLLENVLPWVILGVITGVVARLGKAGWDAFQTWRWNRAYFEEQRRKTAEWKKTNP